MSTLLAQTPDGPIVARAQADGSYLVDHPLVGRFREVHPGPLYFEPAADFPSNMEELCGWYEGHGREILLSQVPEAYFGEPMILIGEADRVMRAYPVTATRLLADDGTVIDLGVGGQLHRSSRYREIQVDFPLGPITLAGTVIMPAAPGPHPAAVAIHGAAGGQRDFMRLLIKPILDAGVAVLIYDKPGHGRSGGSPDPSIFDQADAAQAGLNLLAAIPGIDPSRVGVAGFSNGMWAAPMLAARSDVAFVVGIGAPGVSMAESEVHRRTKILRDVGVGPATLSSIGEAWRCIFTIVSEGAAADDISSRLARALQDIEAAEDLHLYEVPGYVRENPMLSPIPPLMPVADLVSMMAGHRDPQLAHDPADDYAKVSCPVFLQYGSDDTSVPVDESVSRISRAMPSGRLTTHVYPGLEHLLNIIPRHLTGLTQEELMYGFHHFTFGPAVGGDLTDWLQETLKDL